MHTTKSDEFVFLQHFLQVQDMLKSFILVSTGHAYDAEDLFQEVALVLWKKYAEFDESRSFQAWAFGVARFEILAWRRDHARERMVFSNEAIEMLAETSCETTLDLNARLSCLRRCIAQLGQPARSVVTMRHVSGMSLARIAQECHKSEGAIEVMMVRIRRALRACVDKVIANEGVATP